MRIKAGLFPIDTQHYFAMRADDSTGNRSPVSKVSGLFYNSRGDITPPSAVTDLAVTGEDDGVSLQFTAPGDDLDTATNASVFLIRFSTSDFSDQFNTSEAVTVTEDDLTGGSLIPPTGGERVGITVKREIFSKDVTYFFAMKTKDHSDNWSEMSNVVTYTSSAATPALSVLFIIVNFISSYSLLC